MFNKNVWTGLSQKQRKQFKTIWKDFILMTKKLFTAFFCKSKLFASTIKVN